ncbi:hypothetical protein N7491_000010 [Penicillium cf. griseofulvum]|uniref:YCII-related domain-containing protein n=1 Tax=Penicillium cf. griseofulvum TaxID=2972120 RepID=A0A9W9MFV7_9EURO|nr:hypothetical protein N7472_004636 [Penicillium cf. griseofulvum]KAJ5442199.1 hypothetical protein N7445_005206 [Penicillium cf. griseofulvum]KAJ5450828.1 hypothetical protein N7491_000010 [Penicillium cf. griseofulvum]
MSSTLGKLARPLSSSRFLSTNTSTALNNRVPAHVFTKLSTPSELLVVFPDMPNVLERRIKIRPRHSPNFVRLHNEGYVSWAGPLFEKHVNETIHRPFKGSAMVVNEEVKDGLMEKLASDIYVKEKVWDVENALVVPFRTIMRWHKV